MRLEQKLKIPEASRSTFEGELRKAAEITIKAHRVWRCSEAITLDSNGRIKKGKENKNGPSTPGPNLASYFTPRTPRRDVEQDAAHTPEPRSTVYIPLFIAVIFLTIVVRFPPELLNGNGRVNQSGGERMARM